MSWMTEDRQLLRDIITVLRNIEASVLRQEREGEIIVKRVDKPEYRTHKQV